MLVIITHFKRKRVSHSTVKAGQHTGRVAKSRVLVTYNVSSARYENKVFSI